MGKNSMHMKRRSEHPGNDTGAAWHLPNNSLDVPQISVGEYTRDTSQSYQSPRGAPRQDPSKITQAWKATPTNQGTM